jgi:hypothetical protein
MTDMTAVARMPAPYEAPRAVPVTAYAPASHDPSRSLVTGRGLY